MKCQNFSRYKRRFFSQRCKGSARVTLTLECREEEKIVLELCNACAYAIAKDALGLGWSANLKRVHREEAK